MTPSGFDYVALPILAFIFGAGWGYYTAAVKWRNRSRSARPPKAAA